MSARLQDRDIPFDADGSHRTSRREILGQGAKVAGAGAIGLAAASSISSLGLSTSRVAAQDATPDDATPAGGSGTPNEQMQALLDEFQRLNTIPPETQTPFNARQLPAIQDAVTSLLSQSGEPALEEVADIEHVLIPTPNGDLVARVYTPSTTAPHPVIVYYHGGGWVFANLNTYDSSCRALCNAAEAVVISVAYRQAPEVPFPGPVDDAYFAFQYIAENAGEFAGDPERVAIAGESAGGNMATVVSILARDQGGIAPVHQLLVYPVTTFLPEGEGQESIEEFAVARPLNAALLDYFAANYVPDDASRADPSASPLLAADLSDLPPATIIAAEIDPLVGQGRQYADALEAAGVDVVYSLYEGVTHEFFGTGAVVDEGNEAVAEAAGRLQESF